MTVLCRRFCPEELRISQAQEIRCSLWDSMDYIDDAGGVEEEEESQLFGQEVHI